LKGKRKNGLRQEKKLDENPGKGVVRREKKKKEPLQKKSDLFVGGRKKKKKEGGACPLKKKKEKRKRGTRPAQGAHRGIPQPGKKKRTP